MLQQEKSVNCNKHLKCHIKPLFNHYKKKIRDRSAIDFDDRSITSKFAIEDRIENRQILSDRDRDRESRRRDRTASLEPT